MTATSVGAPERLLAPAEATVPPGRPRGRAGVHRPLTSRVAPRFGQLVRYGAVSVIATVTSMVVLGALVATGSTTPGWANVIATAVGTVPSFELNRRWVWGRTDARRLLAQATPFAVLSFAGLAISTSAVSLAGRWATAVALGPLGRTVTVELANLAAFGSLWVAQFLILDRLLFGRGRPATA